MALTTLYVGNLPWETSAEELEQVFGEYGKVTAVRIIIDAETGRSKGFGFVEMSLDAATHAQTRINGARLRGRSLVVAIAKTRPVNPVNKRESYIPDLRHDSASDFTAGPWL